ncbi:hypothetical protein HPB50_001652 [Hyalomma asiaticum]|uniref:Uncharacterized protein n=1 Tax=Hyalomma asiaticum TaxID=266040 RepID=A0ACB7RRX1_HYAAI|nr:hypothetical protein HPB50_001652 [Hyalomma asiaticum]
MVDRKPGTLADGTEGKALDFATKRGILTELSQGAKNWKLVKKRSTSKSTISTSLKNKDKVTSADDSSVDRKRLQRATYAGMEDALLEWCRLGTFRKVALRCWP